MSENEAGGATAPSDGRREALSAAIDKVSPAPVETPKAAETPAAASAEPTAAERARDDKGRFAPRAEQVEAAKAVNPDAVVETAPVEAPKPARKYPSSWKKDYEPIFQELAGNEKYKSILDEVERRENDFHTGIKRYDEDAKFAQSIRKSIAPFEATIRTLGVAPEQAIQGLLASDHALRYGSPAQKAQAVRSLFQSYGLDAQTIFGQQQQQAAADPNYSHLEQQLQQVQQTNQQLLSSFQKQMADQANAELESFKKDKPYFDEVREEMGLLYQAAIQANRPITLQEAYDKAVYATPATREKLLAEQQAKAEAERKAKAQQAVTQAKSAAVQVKGAPPGASQGKTSKPKDRRAAIAEAMNAIRS